MNAKIGRYLILSLTFSVLLLAVACESYKVRVTSAEQMETSLETTREAETVQPTLPTEVNQPTSRAESETSQTPTTESHPSAPSLSERESGGTSPETTTTEEQIQEPLESLLETSEATEPEGQTASAPEIFTVEEPALPELQEIYTHFAPYLVSIQVWEQKEKPALKGNSCGLLIDSQGLVLTNFSNLAMAFNRRGVRQHESRLVIQRGEERYGADLMAFDRDSDLVLLRLHELSHGELSLSPQKGASPAVQTPPALMLPALDTAVIRQAEPGEEVFVLAYPDLDSAAGGLSRGYVTDRGRVGLTEAGYKRCLYQTDAYIPLSSSGALVVGRDGALLGMANCALQRTTSDRCGYFYGGPELAELITALRSGAQRTMPYLGIIAYDERPNLAVELPQGIMIQEVMPNSPAYTAGLRKQDIILSINGRRLQTAEDLRSLLQEQGYGASLELAFYRMSKGEQDHCSLFTTRYP